MVPGLQPAGDGSTPPGSSHGNEFTEAIANLHWFPETIEGRFGDGSELRRRPLLQPRAAAARGPRRGPERGRLSSGQLFLVILGHALTDIDLRAMADFHESHDGIATSATKRLADTSQFGVAITDEDGGIQGSRRSRWRPRRSPTSPMAASTCSALGDLRLLPRAGMSKAASEDAHPASPTGRWTSSRPCWPTMPRSTRTRFHRYWNDIGNLEELRQGTWTRCWARSRSSPARPRSATGSGSAGPAGGCGRQRPGASWGRGSC